MRNNKSRSVFWAILAAALYAISSPVSKQFLQKVDAAIMAAFLYLGAGLGMFLLGLFVPRKKEAPLTRGELPYTVGMVVLDIAAPVFLMMGLKSCHAAHVSLLNNFEIVATSLLASVLFYEKISPKLFGAIGLITLASILLSFEGAGSFSFSKGSLFVILACLSWGMENNCTRMLSKKDPLEIVVIKGFGAGSGSLILGMVSQETFPNISDMIWILVLGFVSYGLSIFFYVYAQRTLGASKTSAYYAVSPFIGAVISMVLFGEKPEALFFPALLIMAVGTALVTMDELGISPVEKVRGLQRKFLHRPGSMQ